MMVTSAALLKTLELIPFMAALAALLYGLGRVTRGNQPAGAAWWVSRPVMLKHHGVERELSTENVGAALAMLGQAVEVSELTGRKAGPARDAAGHDEVPVGEIAE